MYLKGYCSMARPGKLLIFWFAFAIAVLAVTESAVPSSQESDAQKLVRQLGDESFAIRQAAYKKLQELGKDAVSALQEGARHADPEIRRQCNSLLKPLEGSALQARLDAFVADKQGKAEHDLPGWKTYCKVVGSDAAARSFFIE